MARSIDFDRRDQLVEVASWAFGELGWFGCRLDDIAQRAGITKAIILRHWESKEALFLEVRVRLIERYRGRVEQAVRGLAPGVERDRRTVAATMDMLTDVPGAEVLLGGIRSSRAPGMTRAQDDFLLVVASLVGFGSPLPPDDVTLVSDAATVGLCVGLGSGPTRHVAAAWAVPLADGARTAVRILAGGPVPGTGAAEGGG